MLELAKSYHTFIAEATQKAVAEFAPHQKAVGLLMPKIVAANKGEKVVFTTEEQATLKNAAAAAKQFQNTSGLFTPKNLAALTTQINNAKGIQAAANKYAKSDAEKMAAKMANGTLIEQHQGGTQSLNKTNTIKMEPKLGQLGTVDQVMAESENLIVQMRNAGRSALEQLDGLTELYNANRYFTRVGDNIVDDTTNIKRPSINIKRYIYTLRAGWLDMHHVYHVAAFTIRWGTIAGAIYSSASEFAQNNESSFSYEDIASDAVGMLFAELFAEQISNNTIMLETAIQQLITALDPVAPEDAPNFEFIPHLIDKDYILKSTRMLIGDELREEHQKIHNSRPIDLQEKIREAHEQIRD